ncbi:PucR family transcriptional regulator [Actinomadura macrotermitis]|uniref:PucR family transcriptional regulator n=1 Tax=Actinomadura macrotermitis TaxID=2585200 RepID=A0A7K0BYD9_9ACTN|nr:helix-turn-helix domain-containing protein [Actinomadura macrotermitis]MQY05872.1 hypothetical protein [Actinomadura macrotermitis]
MQELRLVDWYSGNVPELARMVTEECYRAIPYYAAMTRETLNATMLPSAELAIGFSAHKLREGRTAMSPEERQRVIKLSARRAEQGVPLEAALLGHHLGIEMCWRAVAEEAREDEAAQVMHITRHLFGFLREVVPAVTVAHVQAQQKRHDEQREALRMLHGALLAGEPAEAYAVRAGVELADSYQAVVLRFGGLEHSMPRTVRALRDVQEVLGGTLATVSPRGVDALLPGSGAADTLARLMADVGRAAHRPIVAAVADAAGRDLVPAAAEEAREVAALVSRLGRPPGVYTLDDVLLEYQLARPGHGLDRLAARLEPVADRPDLVETLRAFVRHGHNRRLAADDLHVHRNTLDYRLRGIAQRTGLDPADPRQAQLLAAALNAHDLLNGL